MAIFIFSKLLDVWKIVMPGQTFINHWPKWLHINHKITQDIAKAIGCSPQTDGKTVLLKTTLIYFFDPGEFELSLYWIPYLLTL